MQLHFQERFFVKSITETGLKTIEVYIEGRNDLPIQGWQKRFQEQKRKQIMTKTAIYPGDIARFKFIL